MARITRRRFFAVAIALVAVLAVMALLAPRLMPAEALRAAIEQRFLALSSRPVQFADPQLRLLPMPWVVARNLVIPGGAQQGDKAALQVSELRGRISLRSLLTGRPQIVEYRLLRPKLRLKRNADGSLSWPAGDGKIANLLELAREARLATGPNAKPDFSRLAGFLLGRFTIVDGAVDIVAAEGTESATNIDLEIYSDRVESPLSASGAGIFRNEKFDVRLRTANPLAFGAGVASPTELELSSGAFRLEFSGDAALLPGLHANGKAALASSSLRRLLTFLQVPVEPGDTFGEFSVSGDLIATPTKYELQEAAVSLDGNDGRGVLLMARAPGQRPQLNGTLAFSDLDITPYWNAIRDETRDGASDLRAFDTLSLLETDLRISAPAASVGQLRISDFAASLALRNSELSLDVGNAGLLGGVLTAKLVTSKRGELATLDASARLAGYSLGELAKLLKTGKFGWAGQASSDLHAISSGTNVEELAQRFAGEISLTAKAGALSGIDLAAIASGPAGAELGEAVQLTGETAFSELSASLFLDRNHLWISDLTLAGEDVAARVTGRADYSSGGLALRVSCKPRQGAGASTNLLIGGVLSNPLVSRYAQEAE